MRPVKKDEGYAWVVLACGFGCLYLVGAFAYSVGVIHVELLRLHEPEDADTLSWAGSLIPGLANLGAPVSCWLVDRFSCRTSVMLGGVVMALGFVTSAFTSSAAQLVLTYGLVAGFGFGTAYSAALMAVSFRFNKRLALASGISSSGAGIGIITGPLLVQALIDFYGMKGAFVMLGGIALQYCVLGVLFIPTEYDGMRPLRNMCKAKRSKEPGCVQGTERITGHDNIAMVWNESDRHSVDPHLEETMPVTNTEKNDQTTISERDRSCQRRHSVQLNVTTPTDTETSNDPKQRNIPAPEFLENNSRRRSVVEVTKGYIKTLVSLRKNGVFVLHCASVFFSIVNILGVLLFLPEYVVALGSTPTSAATLFLGVGATSLVTRVGCGVLLTSCRLDGLALRVFVMGQCGVATCLFHLYSASYAGQMVFACLFGMASGAHYALVNPILQQLGLQTVTTAYGFVIFVMGVGGVVGPPLAEWTRELGGTFTHCFVFLGVIMLMSAFCDLTAFLLSKYQKRKHPVARQQPQKRLSSTPGVDNVM